MSDNEEQIGMNKGSVQYREEERERKVNKEDNNDVEELEEEIDMCMRRMKMM